MYTYYQGLKDKELDQLQEAYYNLFRVYADEREDCCVELMDIEEYKRVLRHCVQEQEPIEDYFASLRKTLKEVPHRGPMN